MHKTRPKFGRKVHKTGALTGDIHTNMNIFARTEGILVAAIHNLELDHINPLKNHEEGLSIARVTNDSVAFTSAGASLAFPIAAIPCLATTVAASLSILGTAMADSIIHSMAESRVKEFIDNLKSKLNVVIMQDLQNIVDFEQFYPRMHAESDPLGALAHFLFVSAEVVEHVGPTLIKSTAESIKAFQGVSVITKLASPMASEAVKVIPFLGAVFSGLSLTHSAWTFHNSSGLLDNMELLKDHLEGSLRRIAEIREVNNNADALFAAIFDNIH